MMMTIYIHNHKGVMVSIEITICSHELVNLVLSSLIEYYYHITTSIRPRMLKSDNPIE